mmetsp:Transcript_6644/g.21208  ORF Transcript_6644/g.21208 Transcript_6644/m.21208 type:complete len:309 (-) Transcript_6644:563-1489(-)
MHPHTRAVVLLSTQLRPCQLSALTPPSTCRRKSPRRHFRLQHALTPQLGQLLEGGAKLAREHRLVCGKRLEVHAEVRVPRQSHVRQQHHLVGVVTARPERTLVNVLPVARRRPQLGRPHVVEPRVLVADQPPLVLEHVRRVLVREASGVLHPRARVARRSAVAPPVHVAAAEQRHDLSVAEAHPVKDFIADVAAQLLPARRPARRVGRVVRDVLLGARQPAVPSPRHRVAPAASEQLVLALPVDPAGPKGNRRPSRVLDAHIRSQDPQVAVGDAWKLPLDGLEEGASRVQPRILAVGRLGIKAHPRAV